MPLRLIPRDAVVPVLQGPLRGKRWIAGAGTHSCWLGCYEPNKQTHLVERLKAGDVVYDLGANAGYFSLLASVLVGETGSVFSFEPHPASADLLRRHLQINGIAYCIVIEAAVGSREGTGYFQSTGDASMGALVNDSTIDASEVRIVTLDGLVDRGEIPPPALIKCDVEGAELEVLKGAERLLRTCHPAILLDLHYSETELPCRAFLQNLGYELTILDDLPFEETSEVLAVWPEKETDLERTAPPSQPVF